MVRYQTTTIRIDQVQQGFWLAIPSGGDQPPRRLVVDDIKVTHNKAAGEQPTRTLTSHLPDGNEWKINFHAGALVTRILGVEDDDNDDT
jgi:hypothetical protein